MSKAAYVVSVLLILLGTSTMLFVYKYSEVVDLTQENVSISQEYTELNQENQTLQNAYEGCIADATALKLQRALAESRLETCSIRLKGVRK